MCVCIYREKKIWVVGVCMQKGMLATMLVVLAHSLNRPLDAVTMHIFGIVLIFMNDSILSLVNIVYNLLCSLSKKKKIQRKTLIRRMGKRKARIVTAKAWRKVPQMKNRTRVWWFRFSVSVCHYRWLPFVWRISMWMGKPFVYKKEGSLHWHLIFNHVPCMSHRQSS